MVRRFLERFSPPLHVVLAADAAKYDESPEVLKNR
jgi:hypothetical protein